MLRRWGPAALFVVAGTILGAAVGLAIRKLSPQGGMGFDALADALGALFLGALVGLVLGVIGSRFVAGRFAAASLWLLLALGVFGFAARMPQERVRVPPPPPPFEPAFEIQLFSRIAAGDSGPGAGVGDFPYRELRVSAADSSLTSKGWGEPERRSYCGGGLETAELERFAEAAKHLLDEDYAGCARVDGVSTFSLSVTLEERTNGSAGVPVDCLMSKPSFVRFLADFDRIRGRFAGGSCR